MIRTIRLIFLFFLLSLISFGSIAQLGLDNLLPVRGLSIAAPKPNELDRFIKFINEELSPKGINTLILRVDYNFQYESYPQLRDSVALSKAEVKKLVDACAKKNIKIVPQINLLGHQSWATRVVGLLRVFPEFDETPHVKMPEKYEWPNADGLYCKSYCPLHPDVHKVVFALIDEICDAFKTNAFHAGMDEVFYIGDDKCPRCGGRDKAELFAGEVTKIRNHLASKNRELWIWGDRLIDGKATGMGMWEASMNNTHRAIDMIPKDVIICDWHYERPDQSAVYFAMKGFKVLTCPWRRPDVTTAQVEDMVKYRKYATNGMKDRYYGIVQTVWMPCGRFMDGYYGLQVEMAGRNKELAAKSITDWDSFRAMVKKVDELYKSSTAVSSN
jgi:hypothetical protein